MIHQVTKLFAEYGGLIGLVVLALFGLVGYLIYQQTQITKRLLKAVEENDERLIDLKRICGRRKACRLQTDVKGKDNDNIVRFLFSNSYHGLRLAGL